MPGDGPATTAPFTAFIGASPEEVRAGYARLSLVVEQRHTNPHGVMHGGVVTSMMDSAVGIALGRLRRDARHRPHATIEMNVSFLSGARPGDHVVAEGKIIKVGRSVAFAEAEARRVRDGHTTVIARGRLVFAIRPESGEGAG